MPSFSPEFLHSLRFDHVDLSLIRKIGLNRIDTESLPPKTEKQLAAMARVALQESVESSGKMEKRVCPPYQLKLLIEGNAQARDDSEREFLGYSKALRMIHESGSHMPITDGTILLLHEMVLKETKHPAGVWKPARIKIQQSPAAEGSVRRITSNRARIDIESSIEKLVQSYHSATSSGDFDPIVLAPLLVLDFLLIQPFQHANGRISRLLANTALHHANQPICKYISIERLMEASHAELLSALEIASNGWENSQHDARPWLRYVWDLLLKAQMQFEERFAGPQTPSISKSDRVEKIILRQTQLVSISQLQKLCPGVSRELVRRVLRKLRDEGKIESTGIGRSAKWRILSHS